MNIIKTFAEEWKQELKITKKFLSVLPAQFDWKPHEKSMSLGSLATHIAEIPYWMTATMEKTELDFSKNFLPNSCKDPGEVLALFEKLSPKSIESIEAATDETLDETWSLKNGEMVYFTLPKIDVMRKFVISHLIHHRAQLGVYYRLLGVALPSTYGPSADVN